MKPIAARRTFLKSTVFGLVAAGIPYVQYAHPSRIYSKPQPSDPEISPRYPAIDEPIVKDLVGASHFDLARVKEIVEARPEMARATWDWAFGDWETALGAASHVGRRDIAGYLMDKGARPDIFAYAMLGADEAVRAMILHTPGIQRIAGPHGISLLSHARAGLRDDSLTPADMVRQQRLIDYLESLGDADATLPNEDLTDAEKNLFLGDYRYGPGPLDGFSVKLNMRNMLSLGKIGNFGGALYHRGGHAFSYNGTPSVTVTFQLKADAVKSLTVEEPGLRLVAAKV